MLPLLPPLRLALPGRHRRLTLFGRSLLLLSAELLTNAACWIVAGILFGKDPGRQPILSLSLLAWTIGLRHALDADHISAIDNATRGLISLGQLPVTCGLFFSLGHSTIVIVVNIAIAISTDVADKIGGVGDVGGIVGASVSAAFLFIVGMANSIILYRILRKRRQNKVRRAEQLARGETPNDMDDLIEDEANYNKTIMMKLIGPVVKFVDRPWKMYPVGVLFGFGFDTASSIALLAVSAIAKKGSDGKSIPSSEIVVLPLLFTAGMTLLDSLDSILMLYSYSGFPERSFALFEPISEVPQSATIMAQAAAADIDATAAATRSSRVGDVEQPSHPPTINEAVVDRTTESSPKSGRSQADFLIQGAGIDRTDADSKIVAVEETASREQKVKRNLMSGLSIILTFMSIMVAFSISLITTMGLIGDNCTRCQEAMNADDGGGLAGRWWRFWAAANDNSGYIGAAIVGAFLFIVSSWYGTRWAFRKLLARQQRPMSR